MENYEIKFSDIQLSHFKNLCLETRMSISITDHKNSLLVQPVKEILQVTDFSNLMDFACTLNINSLKLTMINVDRDFKEIVKLRKCLLELTIDNSSISNLLEIRKLKKLNYLSLTDMNLIDYDLSLIILPKITTLDLSYSLLSNIDFIENMNNLEVLYIDNTNINSLNKLIKLEKLIYVYIYGCSNLTEDHIKNMREIMPNTEFRDKRQSL